MGQAVARAVIADDAAELVALVARPGSALVGTEVTALLGADAPGLLISETLVLEDVDVVVDFTLPESTLHTCEALRDSGYPRRHWHNRLFGRGTFELGEPSVLAGILPCS
jgi:4-hydroxy-tetrahydrodipicolinate reductase